MAKTQRTAVITGASRGIGEACWRLLASQGWRTLGVARSEPALASTSAELEGQGCDVDYEVADLADLEQAASLARRLGARESGLAAVILNAGHARGELFANSSPSGREAEFALNYFSPLVWVQELRPRVGANRGSFVLVGSLTGAVPFPGNANYAASKAALATAVRNLRLEEQLPVHYGLVLPGLTETAQTAGKPSVLPAASPASVARSVERCLRLRLETVIPGAGNRLAYRAERLAPRAFDLAVRVAGGWLIPGLARTRQRDV